MSVIFYIVFFIFGAAIGSFVCCQVRRTRLYEEKGKRLGSRSVCMHCGKKINWFENIPVISWLALKGRCHNCGHKIGSLEIIAEIVFGFVFLFVGFSFGDLVVFSILDWLYLIFIFTFISVLGFLFIYDGKWGELPQGVLISSVIVSIVSLILKVVNNIINKNENFGTLNIFSLELYSVFVGVMVLAGLYFVLYYFSKGKLVGDGDWILGLAISLCLGNWKLCFWVLFLSNFLSLIIMYPMTRKNKTKRIYFGPWMILGFLIVFVFRDFFLTIF